MYGIENEFLVATELATEAQDRLRRGQFDTTQYPSEAGRMAQDHGHFIVSAVHHYTRTGGHHLVMLAHDEHGVMAAAEAIMPEAGIQPSVQIVKFRAGMLTFHMDVENAETWRATTRAGDTYTLTVVDDGWGVWGTRVNDGPMCEDYDLGGVLNTLINGDEDEDEDVTEDAVVA